MSFTFQTQTVKECRLCFKAKRAICHFFIRFVSKILHAWRRNEGGRKWKNKQNHDSMHDFTMHHFCILKYQTLHFIFATWVYKSIKFKIAEYLKITQKSLIFELIQFTHLWIFHGKNWLFILTEYCSIPNNASLSFEKKLAHQMKWILSIPRFTSLMSSENFAKSLEFCDSFKGWKGGFKVRDGEGLAQEFWL